MSDKLTTSQFAKIFKVTPFRIRQMIRNGTIQAEKFGRDYMIDPKYIEIVRNRPEQRGKYERKKAA